MRLLFLLLIAGSVQAQAPSFLALCHKDWNCQATVKLYNGQQTIVTGWLENTFNSKCLCAERLLNDPRAKIARIHLANSVCMRNKRCGRYEVFAGETIASANRQFERGRGRSVTKFKQVLARLKQRLVGVNNLTCYVSPCLECDLNETARRFMADLVSVALPNCNLVDNPHRKRCLPGATCEKHGIDNKLSAPCIIDLDGIDGTTVDVKSWIARYKHCDLSYYWEPWMNCLKGKFVDPQLRRCRYSFRLFDYIKGVLCQYYYPLFGTCLL